MNDLQNQVIRDVRVAWLNATTAYDRMALTKQLLEQANIALDLAQTRYDAGLGNIVELSTRNSTSPPPRSRTQARCTNTRHKGSSLITRPESCTKDVGKPLLTTVAPSVRH